MTHGSSHAEPSRMADLMAILGPEQMGELADPSATDSASIDSFAKSLAGMTDEQIRSDFHASDGLLADLRELQAVCGF